MNNVHEYVTADPDLSVDEDFIAEMDWNVSTFPKIEAARREAFDEIDVVIGKLRSLKTIVQNPIKLTPADLAVWAQEKSSFLQSLKVSLTKVLSVSHSMSHNYK